MSHARIRVGPGIEALALFAFLVMGCVNSRSPSNNQSSTTPTSTNSARTASTRQTWNYSDHTDEMGRGQIVQASILSANTISLESPYGGAQHGTLILRQHPQYGKDVIVTIEKGQLLDSDYHGQVLTRFDDDKPRAFSSVRPADGSSESLFLRGGAFPIFFSRLKTAKTLRIEVPIYQAGNQVFVFDVEGFSWKK